MCQHCRPSTIYCPKEIMSKNYQQNYSSVGSTQYYYQQQQQQYYAKQQASRSSPKSRSRSPPQSSSSASGRHSNNGSQLLGYSPPARQLAGGRVHEPPRAEELPVPPVDWCNAIAAQAQQRLEQEQQMRQLQQMQCDAASLALKRLLNVSA